MLFFCKNHEFAVAYFLSDQGAQQGGILLQSDLICVVLKVELFLNKNRKITGPFAPECQTVSH